MGSCLSSDARDDNTQPIPRNKSKGRPLSHYSKDDITKNQAKPSENASRSSSQVSIVEEKVRPPAEEKKKNAPTIEERKAKSLKLKTEGNTFFKQKNYPSAIKCYTKAIETFDQDSTYYSNRAMCYRFEKEWKNAVTDSESSITLDPTNYKGYFLKAICLVEFGKQSIDETLIEKAIKCFSEALTIYQKKSGILSDMTTEDINTKLQKAKKIEWLMSKEKNMVMMDDTQSYLSELISKDKKAESQKKKEALDIINYCRAEREREYRTNNIPDFFTCKISFELMKNPVVTPEGFAYEKSNICEHINKNGPTDPLSRHELQVGQLIENEALKQGIDGFKSDNPWSFDYLQPNEKFEDVLIS